MRGQDAKVERRTREYSGQLGELKRWLVAGDRPGVRRWLKRASAKLERRRSRRRIRELAPLRVRPCSSMRTTVTAELTRQER